MDTVNVKVNRVGGRSVQDPSTWFAGPADLEADMRRARLLATWLDAKFEFMGVRFGADSIIGLVPVLGDTLTALASSYLIYVARRHDLGKMVQTRMAFNILVDWLPGLVPVVGDLIDVAYKANLKNLKLLEAAAEKKLRRQGGEMR
jgi:hypothetical protein